MYKTIFGVMAVTAVSIAAEFIVTVMTLICMGRILMEYNWPIELNILAMTLACLLTTALVIVTVTIYVKDRFTIDEDPV